MDTLSSSRVAACTIVAKNYLALARTLADSLREFHPEISFYLLVIDAPEFAPNELDFHAIKLIAPSNLMAREQYDRMAQSYNVTEFSTALKPFFLRHLIERGHERVMYFDPDILVMHPIDEITQSLDKANIVLTPHLLDPMPLDGLLPNEMAILKAGAYNLGFIGIKSAPETLRFLDWWSTRLEKLCKIAFHEGLFVDQKWIDLVPGLFDGVTILKNPALNVAYWNIFARKLSRKNGKYHVGENKLPLVFYHFSGYDPQNPNRLSRYQNRVHLSQEPILRGLLQDYAEKLEANGHGRYRESAYTPHHTFKSQQSTRPGRPPVKIGFISPFWLPRHGGIEQYDHRLAHALSAQGLEVHAFTGTAEKSGRDNGDFPVTRWAPDRNINFCSWRSYFVGNEARPDPGIFKLYRFMEAATAWAVSLGLDIVLISSPLQNLNTNIHQARELYLQLKAHGIKVGAAHHDLGRRIEFDLLQTYKQNPGNWDATAEIVTQKIGRLVRGNDSLWAYHHIGSPLFFSPDFVISCSNWSNRFIDPTGKIPAIVVHPLMDAQYWSQPAVYPEGLENRDVLMVNPQRRKGPEHMADLIAGANPDWTFRILKGGWGDAFKRFVPMVENLPASTEHRIDFRDYVVAPAKPPHPAQTKEFT